MDVCVSLIVVIISQCIHIWNYCVLLFKHIYIFFQLYLNKAGKNLKTYLENFKKHIF